MNDIQKIIDQAVLLATRQALRGSPVKRILWKPPTSPTQDPIGGFIVVGCEKLSASDTPPWGHI